MKTRVSRILGVALGTDDDQLDETALMEELANEAVQDLLARTRINIRSAVAQLTGGEDEYEIDETVLRFHGVRRNGNLLTEMAREELLPDGVCFPGHNRVKFGSPIAGAGEEIEFWYTPLPTPMMNDDDDPSLPQFGHIPAVFHRAILNYICWHMADAEGDAGAGRGERYRVLYEGKLGTGDPGSNLAQIRTKASLRGGAVLVRRRREVLASDTDPSYWMG